MRLKFTPVRSDIKRADSKNKIDTPSNMPHVGVPKYPNICQPSIVLTNILKTSSNEPSLIASRYLVVMQPKVVLIDCLRRSMTCTSPKRYAVSTDSTKKNKIKEIHDSYEWSFGTPGRAKNPTGRATLGQSEDPKLFHVPTWRQLSKQQQGSSDNLKFLNDFKFSNKSRASSETYIEYNSSCSGKFCKKRNVLSDEPSIVPTWRQLTKLQSGSSKHQNSTKYPESGSSCVKVSRRISESKNKMKRRHSEGSYNLMVSRYASLSSDSQYQSNSSASKRRKTSREETCLSYKASSKFLCETQKSDVIVLPTLRQLSSHQSDHLNIQGKSLESYQNREISINDGNSNYFIRVNHVLVKAKPITANLTMPTIQISRADSYDVLDTRHKMPKTPGENPDQDSDSPILVIHYDLHKANPTLNAADLKVPTVQISRAGSHDVPARHKERKTTADDPDQYSHSSNLAKQVTESSSQIRNSSDEHKTAPKPGCLESFTKIIVKGEQWGNPQYGCSMCDYKINHLGMIWNHVKFHGVMPYACDECDYRTVTLQLLRNHKITHAGERRFPCDDCDQRCRTNTHLRIHKILYHELKPMACHKCEVKKC